MIDSSNRSGLKATVEDTTVYLYDDRRTVISQWMRGNPKLGPGVYSYSRIPGDLTRDGNNRWGTCPGSTDECERICYAKRIVNPLVLDAYVKNSKSDEIPPLPSDAKLVRIHVSGDFDSIEYIGNWVTLVREHPDVHFWGYTRSWRVEWLRAALWQLREEPNVQLFASVDKSMAVMPSDGWRIAWIDGDGRLSVDPTTVNFKWKWDGITGERAYVCPEELGRKPNCASCLYCVKGQRGDVVFLEH